MRKSIFISLLAVLLLTAATPDKKTTIFVIGDSTMTTFPLKTVSVNSTLM